MQIEEGKSYITRDGRKVGPMQPYAGNEVADWKWESDEYYHRADGTAPYCPYGDIIAEWSEGPVRTETVTKRRIVPGVYGPVKVLWKGPVGPSVILQWVDSDGEMLECRALNATELDDLAMVASQLAEALRDVD